MKIFNVGTDPLDEKDIKATGAIAAFYWYESGCYDGRGYLLLLINEKWYLHDCGHCSCYGPTERIELHTLIANKLSKIKNKCSSELWRDIKILVNKAIATGYQEYISSGKIVKSFNLRRT